MSIGLALVAALPADPLRAQDSPKVQLEEIVVTAQKREERLQDVPISIAVLGGEELDNSTSGALAAALNRVPGVVVPVSNQNGAALISVRGVTPGGVTPVGPTAVAFYLDSAPFGLVRSAISPDVSVYDLDRIEVLRGPQGTLYGASSLNGVMRILTKDPNLDEFEVKVRLGSSMTDEGGTNYRGDTAINVPLVDGRLALRAVAGYEDTSGWVDRPNKEDVNEGVLKSFRMKIGAQPLDQLSVVLSAWTSDADWKGIPTANDAGTRNVLIDEPLLIDTDLASLKLTYDAAAFTVWANSSYLEYQMSSLKRSIFSASFNLSRLQSRMFAQEVGLSSSSEGPFRWTLGAIYRNGTDKSRQNAGPNVALLFTNPFIIAADDRSESVAGFGEVSYRFTEQLELTLGLRYYEDRVAHDDRVVTNTIPYHPRANFDATTPRAILTWYPSERVTAYASYAEGFRSGSNQSFGARNFGIVVEPDTLKNYEIGTKADLLDRRFSLEGAVYYMDWADTQQALTVPVVLPGGTTGFLGVVTNSETASGWGAELATIVRPIDGLEFALSASWNDLAFEADTLSRGVVLFDEGDRPNSSSEYTYGASIDYSFRLGANGLRGGFSASASFQSEQASSVLLGTAAVPAVASVVGDDILLGRAAASIHGREDRWGLTLFCDNVTDENGATLGAYLPPFSPFGDDGARLRPRTYGAQLEFRY